jgi:hypothetical protein
VAEDDLPNYESAVEETARLRDSAIVEFVLLGLAYAVTWYRVSNLLPGDIGSWHALHSEYGLKITLAGWWYALVCIPIFQFLVYRWFWRLITWTRFLWRMSRLNLQLIPTHPDLPAGLGFLGITPTAFGLIPFSLGTVLSGILGREILFNGASLWQFQYAIIGFVVLSLNINFGPLLVFVGKLAVAKRKGMLEYGALADKHDRAFHRKWVSGENPEEETILSNPDPSSLADIGAGYERIHNMRVVPFDLRTVISLTVTAIIPLLPLLLTVYPFNELIKRIFEILV